MGEDTSINPARRPRPLIYAAGRYPRGTYVVATKWSDGDPGDGYCVGFYYGSLDNYPGDMRHMVVNGDGETFRHNGFRRVERVSGARGTWIVRNMPMIERMMDRFSVWHWVHASKRELAEWEGLMEAFA